MEKITIIISLLTVLVSIFVAVYTVHGRARNENKENHKPYLVLKSLQNLKALDQYKYYIKLKKEDVGEEIEIPFNIILENIGYGVASNIKFYDLLTGECIKGTQLLEKNMNQQLFTTLDVASNNIIQIQMLLTNYLNKNGISHNRILCIYQDLNENIYDFIIHINIKNKKNYDFYAYQRSSKSYQKCIEESKKEYNHALKNYKGEEGKR